MPSKTPWPNALGGLASGLEKGMRMGLMARQQNLAEQESLAKAAAEKEKKNFEQGTKYLELAVEYQKTGNPIYKKKALQFTSEGLKLLGKDPLPDEMEWLDGFDPVAKDVETAIKGFRKFGDRAVFEDALNAAYMKAGQVLEDDKLKDFKVETEKRAETEIGQQQADYLSQASQIPYLEQAGVLSPDEAREGRYAALSGAGTKGVELLAKGLEGAEGKEEKALTPAWKIIDDKTSPTGFSYQNLNNPKDVRKGAPKPRAGAEVNVSLGGLSKTSQTKLEEDIMGADNKIEAFDEIEKLSNSAYLTYKGEAIAGAQKYAEKMGIPVDTKFLEERTAWKQQAMSAFLEWRKWITGVAGGAEEMKQISKSFPDPERNSPTEFKANLEQARLWTKKLRNRWIILRSLGIDKPTKDDLARFPLEHIPEILPKQLQQPQPLQGNIKVNIDDLSDDELLNILGGE